MEIIRAKDLKSKYNWEQRCPHIDDQVFFIPEYYEQYEDFQFPQWSDSQVFGSDLPIHIEFGSGNGMWVTEKAREEKHHHWVGVEIRFDRTRKIWARMKNLHLQNLFLVCGDAFTFAKYYIPKNSVDAIYINFPDPWPKRRHEKHRLINPLFISELVSILKLQGQVFFVTDDVDYLQFALRHFLANRQLMSAYPHPYFVKELSGYGTSFFEELWREQGKDIHYMQWIKVGDISA